ncbi:sigma-70 family RNA polymerase sigma factor [Brevibacillus borstelensis]|uniref:sigma-70 family RNA polymerase sigma factor n=1 Tax=Brevibacillus borstelensis TaxID=45462 RepID=UPI003D8130E0
MVRQLQDTGKRCSGGQLFYEQCTTRWSIIRLAFTRFVNFYLEIRLVKYISTIIHYSVIELHLRNSKKEKSLLPYDETIHDKHFSTTNTTQNTILDDKIPINCFNLLTKKEKNIIYFIFYKELREAEIARYLNISQQAVSKTKRRALQKIREELKKEEQR